MSGQAGVRLSSFQYLQNGVAHFNAGRFDEALGAFRSAIAAGESVPEARTFLGHVAASLGRPDEARASFLSVLSDFPRHLPAYDGLANQLLRLAPERDPGAESALRRVLAVRAGPGLAATLGRCGQALRAAGDLDGAQKILLRSVALGQDGAARKKFLAVLRLRADAHLAAGDHARAEAGLRKVLALEPKDERARAALVRLLRARALAAVSAGRLDAAEKALRRAVALSPRDAGARRQRASVAALRRRSKSARAAEARRLEAEKLRLLRGRGGALVAAGRLAEAEAAFRKALLASPNSGAGRQLAEVLRMREQAREAKLQAARAAKGERLRALLEEIKAAGQAYRSSARARLASASLRRLLRLSPSDARARLVAGGVLFSAGQDARGKALLTEALRLDGGTLTPGERFCALMKLGRYKAALAEGEALLDGKPTPADLRFLQDPWEWDERPLSHRRRELLKLERLGRASRPWSFYYRADLRGPDELKWFDALEAFPRRRYGWMLAKAGLASLCAGRFEEAEKRLKTALAWKASDWRTRGFLAEALACLGRPREAFAELERARRDAPSDEKGQALAWRGALDLWLGRYASALRRFDAALALGAPYALAWRAAALLKLGRPSEALAGLDEALLLYPRDLEAYVWRAEAKRALGRPREALSDLAEPALAGDGRATPVWLWALVNRALAKAALGDQAGLKADFDALPVEVTAYLRRRTGRREMVELLEASLVLARGYRREEFKQRIWMR